MTMRMMKNGFFAKSGNTSKRTLSQLLTSCSQVANTLNWNKSASLLAIRLVDGGPGGQQEVDLALTSHPSTITSNNNNNNNRATTTSVTIPLGQSKAYLQDLLDNTNRQRGQMNIQGLIIGWPRQPDGWLGYQCGKVFYHLLDAIETSSRPAVCLFDPYHAVSAGCGDDCWGRNPVYGRTSFAAEDVATAASSNNNEQQQQPLVHIASQKQYHGAAATTPMRAIDLADQFCQVHWPEYYQHDDEHQHETTTSTKSSSAADLWAATSSFHGSLVSRSAPMKATMMQQQQPHHSWMSSGDHHHLQGAAHHRRSLASM